MNNSPKSPTAPDDVERRRSRRSATLLALSAAAAVWIAAFSVVTASRLAATMYASFGADLPSYTILVVEATRNDLPWLYALLCTILLCYLILRSSPHLAWASAVLATVTAICISIASVALFLPVSKCGVLWPDWPVADKRGFHWGQAAVNTSPGMDAPRARAPVGSCG